MPSLPESLIPDGGRVLIVDDEADLADALARALTMEGHTVMTLANGAAAVEQVTREAPDVLLLDIRLRGESGLDVLAQVKAIRPELEVVMMTGYATVDSAVAAMKAGAFDYLKKPFENLQRVLITVHKALERKSLLTRTRRLEEELQDRFQFSNVVGVSTQMKDIFKKIRRLAYNESNVLIQGESGTGKELVARAIHYNSPRRTQSFIPLDCGALPEGVIASELFGHVRGSFTGATTTTQGLFRVADRGTVFLDEIGELPLNVQVKLLRVLQEREVRPVGSPTPVKVDIRILAATNCDLEEAVRRGTFRRDLYYRLKVVSLDLPALRDRREDIPPLVHHFIRKYSGGAARLKEIDEAALRLLCRYNWPGNVRELENCIESAMAMAHGDTLGVEDLPDVLMERVRPSVAAGTSGGLSLKAYEKFAIEQALTLCRGDIPRCARMLGIGKSTLYRKMKTHQIAPRRLLGSGKSRFQEKAPPAE
jgi:two-component system response regulator HydG